MYAKSDLKKSVRQAKSIGKTNTKSMSGPLQQSIFRAKILEKSYVFGEADFGGIPCAAHVPPRCRGEKKNISKCKSAVPAAIKSIMYIRRVYAKCMPKPGLAPFQNPARTPPKPSKIEASGVHESQDAAQSSQEHPRGGPKAPKTHPRAAKRRSRASQRLPRHPHEAPEVLRNRDWRAPRRILGAFFAGSSV